MKITEKQEISYTKEVSDFDLDTEVKEDKNTSMTKSPCRLFKIATLMSPFMLMFLMLYSFSSNHSEIGMKAITINGNAHNAGPIPPKKKTLKLGDKTISNFAPIYVPPLERGVGRYYMNGYVNEWFQRGHISYASDKTCYKKRGSSSTILCKINVRNHCKMTHVAEVIDRFWIIAPIYSYDQGKQASLYELHENFRSYMESFGLSFCTIEALREGSHQNYIITKPGREPYDIQVTYRDEFYLRENLLNVAIGKIPEDKWDSFAWIDGHQAFTNLYWWEEAIVKMNKYATLQLFVNSARLDGLNHTIESPYGIIYTTTNYLDVFYGDQRREVGNAYSISKEEYRKIGSILDTCIASFCDCLYVEGVKSEKAYYPIRMTWTGYLSQFSDYVMDTQKIVKGRTGYVKGEILHFQHLRTDFYTQLLSTIVQTDFNVKRDLGRDENGTLFLTNNHIIKALQNTIHEFLQLD